MMMLIIFLRLKENHFVAAINIDSCIVYYSSTLFIQQCANASVFFSLPPFAQTLRSKCPSPCRALGACGKKKKTNSPKKTRKKARGASIKSLNGSVEPKILCWTLLRTHCFFPCFFCPNCIPSNQTQQSNATMLIDD